MSTKFGEFSKPREFFHITSSPYHSRSNGKAEGAVQNAPKKKEDPRKAILEWRNAPNQTVNQSFTEINVQTHTNYATHGRKSFATQNREGVLQKQLQKRVQSKQYYDRISRPLPDLPFGETISVKLFVKDKVWVTW